MPAVSILVSTMMKDYTGPEAETQASAINLPENDVSQSMVESKNWRDNSKERKSLR